MCIGCLAISALTFIIPVSGNSPSIPSPTATPVTAGQEIRVSLGVAKTQKMLQTMLQKVPLSADTQVLRQGLTAASVRLSMATTDQQAQVMLDEEMDALVEALNKAPNAEKLIVLVWEIRDKIDGPATTSRSSGVELQSNAMSLLLQKGLQLHQQSGWLS